VSVHLLGYLFDPAHPAMLDEQARLRVERRDRLVRMVTLLAEDGYPVNPATFLDRFPPELPAGRPHLARALVEQGVVASVDDAFARLLNNSSPYYIPRADTPVERAVRMIDEAGGVAVFAHPFARKRGRVVHPSVISELAGVGLAGVEVDHPDHSPEDRERLRAQAAELGLLATGSSDYHGANKTTPIGAETTAPEAFERLVARARATEVLG
jgi:predicted metal-dependent phosphoesterase TrpH